MAFENRCWYQKGLRFSCARCGKCCGGSPGYVFLKKEEAETIARFLKISLGKFYQDYARILSDGRLSLKETLVSYNCIFLKDQKCQIYPVRPIQCQTFPWWPSLLSAKKNWDEEKAECPGINADGGKLYSFEEIQKELERNLASR